MNRRTKSPAVSILILVFVLGAFSTVFSQIRGIELYNKLRSEQRKLITFEGDRNVRWTPDGDAYIVRREGTFIKLDPQTGVETNLFDDEILITAFNDLMGTSQTRLPFTRFDFIEDGKKIRFYRSNRTEVFFYDLSTHELQYFKVRPPERGVRFASYEEVFSPDYKYTAYGDNYNLYLRDLEKDEVTALTTEGHEDLRNGYPDWVYAEEFAQFYCFWWSPDSKKIAFMQFDESPVPGYRGTGDCACRIDRIQACPVVSAVVCDIAVDNCRFRLGPVHCASFAGLAGGNIAVYEFG